MRTESLHRVVSQTLPETLELMNAARSQCEAQQLLLHSTHYPTEAALKKKIIIITIMDYIYIVQPPPICRTHLDL